MKLFAGKPAECSMLALRPQETPGRQGSIVWSPARTKSMWNQTLGDVQCRWLGGVMVRTLDLRSKDRGFDSQLDLDWLLLGWVNVYGQVNHLSV